MDNNEVVRLEVIKQISERGRLIAEVANDFGVSNRQVYRWLKSAQQAQNKPDPRQALTAKIAALQVQLYSVSRQLEQLQQRVD